MDYNIRNLTNYDYEEWFHYVKKAYGQNHILTDWPFLRWFYGGLKGNFSDKYETLVATLHTGEIVGSYGVLSAKIRVIDQIYSFCWFVSGNVLPEYRNRGIGKDFINILLEQFDVCGVIGFNLGVKRNYARAGFEFFNDRTMRRYIMIFQPDAYELVEKIGYNKESAKELIPIFTKNFSSSNDITNLISFNSEAESCVKIMESEIKVNIVKSPQYLNWRYFLNPRINYNCIAKKYGKKWFAFLVARHERYYPTKIESTRIIDLIGLPANAITVLKAMIIQAKNQKDAFLEFSYAGSYYDVIMEELGFIELKGECYEWWPLVTTPIEKRKNEEFICLGSRKYPDLFKTINFSNLYFVRGDSDRDRANRI